MKPDPGKIEDPRYGVLWDSGPVGAFVADHTGKWQAVNSRWQEITGISEEQTLRVGGLKDQIHPDDAGRLRAEWEQVVRSGDLSQTEFRFEHPDLGLRYASASTIGLRDADNKITAIVGTLTDETERRLAEFALRESEELHRLTIANLPGSAVGLYDRDMHCLLMEGVESRGMTTEEVRGKHIKKIAPPEVLAELMPGIEAALAGAEYSGEYPYHAENEIWTFQTAPFIGADGTIDGFLIVAQDVTERRKLDEERGRANRMFQAAFDRAPIGMAIVGLDERFEQANMALEQMLGMANGELTSVVAFDVVHPEDEALGRKAFAKVIDEGEIAIEIRLVGCGQRVIWVDARAILVRSNDGEPLHILVQIQDVTERRELIARLEHLVEHDSLTGLLNRRGFERALAKQLAAGRRYGKAGVLLLVDLDDFKKVNDTLGHAAGDELLAACSKTLLERLRATDVIARLGGDEFAIILPEQDADGALGVANNLITELARCAPQLAATAPKVTASVGVASLAASELSPDDALILADRAMYEAKRAGRNRAVTHA